MPLKSGLPPILPTSDMMTSTKALTTRPKAAANTKATASSTTLPRMRNFLSPLMIRSSFPDGCDCAYKVAKSRSPADGPASHLPPEPRQLVIGGTSSPKSDRRLSSSGLLKYDQKCGPIDALCSTRQREHP